MNQPNIIILSAKKRFIYIRNILKWAVSNPDIQKNFNNINMDILTSAIDNIVEQFRPLWEKNESMILTSIEHLSGFSWSEEYPYIYVYPIPFFNSFSHPLFLKVCDVKQGEIIARPNGLILGLLIHELCHNNFFGISSNRIINETLINFITLKILNEIDKNFALQYEEFYKRVDTKSIDFTIIPEAIKLGNSTLKIYYEKLKP